MNSVLVLGSTGMLGHAVVAELRRVGVPVRTAARDGSADTRFDVLDGDIDACLSQSGHLPLVVNAIGHIKPLIDDADIASRRMAVAVNSEFPHRLAAAAARCGAHVVQIETDCVFSGLRGPYSEMSIPDPTDVYGLSKRLGEVPADHVTHIRCSIIGPEPIHARSLWEWIAGQPAGARLTGYADHLWNGVTTAAFARICAGIAREGPPSGGTFHLVPADAVSKDELVRLVAGALGRDDLRIETGRGPTPVDRRLATISPEANESLWRLGGFASPPTIRAMVEQAARA
jgi:dTDP-4-dehydrorhamnose reductase